MTEQIYKYILEITPIQEVEVPGFNYILHAGEQDGELCLWVSCCSPDKDTVKIPIHIVGTGHVIPDGLTQESHIQTVIMDAYVWHIYWGQV